MNQQIDLEDYTDLASALRRARLNTRGGYRWRKWGDDPWSIREVAERTGIDRNRLARIEQDASGIKLSEFLRLARLYCLSDSEIAFLMGLHPDHRPRPANDSQDTAPNGHQGV